MFVLGGDRVSFGFSATITKGKSTVRGGLVFIRHFECGGKCRLKSNQMNPSIADNHVTMTGSGNYVWTFLGSGSIETTLLNLTPFCGM